MGELRQLKTSLVYGRPYLGYGRPIMHILVGGPLAPYHNLKFLKAFQNFSLSICAEKNIFPELSWWLKVRGPWVFLSTALVYGAPFFPFRWVNFYFYYVTFSKSFSLRLSFHLNAYFVSEFFRFLSPKNT